MSRLKHWLVEAGLPRLLAPIYGGHGAILVFHRIRPHDKDWLFATNHANSVAPDRFEQLLDALAETGVAVVSLDEAMARLAAPRRERFVCLTFDDGYSDNHDVALPLITARNLPITVYVTPGLIDATAALWWYGLDAVIARETRLRLPYGGDVDQDIASLPRKQAAFDAAVGFMLRADADASAAMVDALEGRYGVDFAALAAQHMMDWTQIRMLAASPLVEIGAHTLSHPSLAGLTAEQARHELAGAILRLEAETGQPVRHLAYPFGAPPAVGPREPRLAAEEGYRTAVTTYPGNLFPTHLKSPMLLPRHGVGPDDTVDALTLKLAGLRRLRSGSWRPVVTGP